MAEYIFTEDDLDMLEEESQSDELNAIHSTIAPDAVLEGELKVKHGIEISGLIKGNIRSHSTIKVAMPGRVEGTVDAYNVVIEGKANLSLSARKRLEIGSSGTFVGKLDVQPEVIVISENAKFGQSAESAEKFHKDYVVNRVPEIPKDVKDPPKKK